jgi:beta-hydroxyacyl-ACP dehydratase FabZ
MEPRYNIQQILSVLPHRYPFILVDRVLELVPGEKVVAIKNVTINEPFFQGHFPEVPVMPGVMILEAMGQAGGLLVNASIPRERRGALIYFMGMDKVKFRKIVVPGDQLILEMTLQRLRQKVVRMSGTAAVDGKIVAEAEMMASLGDAA